ncbi:right-handed parallel beta-helix repeat-containing protein [Treponema phagedenis]|uniref:right-handed parallel beta-helix repeat-containing protein n=1 Tax=Treponema phagedenis TaxID=162 RepID=UPI0009DE3C90|nr:right-handed parallel beta-helix repeat-containing protein [Treponema phagedenis]
MMLQTSDDVAKNILNVAGDDTKGNGTIAKPFLTLNKAWAHCKTLGIGQEITIYIDGEVKGFFLNTGEANNAHIKFKGLSGACIKNTTASKPAIHAGFNTGNDNNITLTIEDLIIDGSGISTFPQNGGGIYFDSNGTLTLNNVTIQNCNATEYGGGVYLINGSLSMNTVEIKKCTASDSGGGIYFDSNKTLTLNNVTIQNCNETGYGGGVYLMNGSLSMNTVEIKKCTASNSGGGIYFKSDKQCILNSCTINECNTKIGGPGGGIYLEGTALTTATIKNSTIKDCKRHNAFYCPDGGGIYMRDKITVTINDTTISGCEGENGGGIYIYDEATLKADNLRIESCKVRLEGGGIKVSGDSSVAGGTVTLTNSNILNCEAGSVGATGSACNGGGVYIGMKSSFTMNGGSISNNKVTRDDSSGGNGGGVYVKEGTVVEKGGSFTMENGSISGNNAIKDGGGIYFASKETLTLANVEIKECVAKTDGGGIFFNEGKGTATNLTVTKCKADKKGGGILIRNSSGTDNFFILEGNSSITENELTAGTVSDRSGTGVYVGNLNSTPFKIKGNVQIGTFGSSRTLTDANDVYLSDTETIYIDKNENLTKNPVAQITPKMYGNSVQVLSDDGGEDIKTNYTKFTVTPNSTTSPPTKYTIGEDGKLQTIP